MAALQRPALPAPRIFGKARPQTRALVIAGAALLVVMAAAFQVNIFSRMASTSYEINALERQHATLQAENRELEAEVAALSSLARVDWEARTRLKMEPPKKTVRVEVNQPVPDRHSLPTRFLPPDVAQPAAAPQGSSWIAWLRELLPF